MNRGVCTKCCITINQLKVVLGSGLRFLLWCNDFFMTYFPTLDYGNVSVGPYSSSETINYVPSPAVSLFIVLITGGFKGAQKSSDKSYRER